MEMSDSNKSVLRTLVVGDVHGCLDELKQLLDKCNYDPAGDRLVMAGDLVDRGPDSAGVVRYVMSLNAECVAGNHEDKLLRRYRHVLRKRSNPQYVVPMRPDLEQEWTIQNMLPSELDWLGRLPTYVELPDYNAVVVPAGMAPGRDVTRQSREVLTMMRFMHNDTHRMMPLDMPGFRQPKDSVYWAEKYDGDVDVLFGHNVVGRDGAQVWERPNGAKCYGLDTGCCFGGRLTACVLTPADPFHREIVQVPALQAYKPYEKW